MIVVINKYKINGKITTNGVVSELNEIYVASIELSEPWQQCLKLLRHQAFFALGAFITFSGSEFHFLTTPLLRKFSLFL